MKTHRADTKDRKVRFLMDKSIIKVIERQCKIDV